MSKSRTHQAKHIASYDKMVTLGFVYVYWKFLGLCPFVYANDDAVRVSCSGLIYAIILAVIYTVCYLRAVTTRTTFTLPRETPMSIIADFGGLSIEFVLIVSSWLLFGFRQKQVQNILLFFKKIHETYEVLGIRVDNRKFFRNIKMHTVIINVAWYFLCVVDHLLLVDNDVFKLSIWLPFNIVRVVSHNIMVMYTDTMTAIQLRFSLLNKRIQELPYEVTTRAIVLKKNSGKDTNDSRLKSLVSPGPIETYGQLHSDLIDLVKLVVEFYSLLVLLIMLTHFIQMSSGLYTLCLVTKDRTVWPWRDIASMLLLCSWFVFHFTEMTILFSVSDSTTKEANQAGNELHKMLLVRRVDRYMDSATILSFRLLHRQLSVDLFGMLQMRLSMIHRIMGMVATYITVMVQLDGQEAP